jgi:transcriptional regulator with XRE-family HTH domain
MSVDYRLIGSRIKLRRKFLGKTQEELAEHLSVSVGYVSQIERGVTKVNLDTLSRIASSLRCDLVDLLANTSTASETYLAKELAEQFEVLTNKQKKMLMEIIEAILRNQ